MDKRYWVHVVMLVVGVLLIGFSIEVSGRASTNGIPREGFFSINENLGEWEDDYIDHVLYETTGNEMHLSIDRGAWDARGIDEDTWSWHGRSWTYRQHRDFSASMDIRQVAGDSSGSGCLMVRADPSDSSEDSDRYSFNFCISEDYGVYYWWGDPIDDAGSWNFDYLSGNDIDRALRPLESWNTLKIIAKDQTIWLFLNDTYIGATRHAGPSRGAIGMRLEVERDNEATFAFRNLTTRKLGWF